MSILGSLGSAFNNLTTGLANTFKAPTPMPNMSVANSTPAVMQSQLAVPKMAAPMTQAATAPAKPLSFSLTGSPTMAPAFPNMSMANSTPSTIGPMAPITSTPAVAAPRPVTPTVPHVTTPASTSTPSYSSPTPAVPQSTVNPHPYVTTPSGAIVDPNTGALISPAGSSTFGGNGANTGSYPAAFVGGPVQPSTPATPNIPSPNGAGTSNLDPNSNPLLTSDAYKSALAGVSTYSQMSPEEQGIQTDLNNLETSYNKAYTNAQGQPIPLDFITGQQMQLQKEAANLSQPLTARAALLQAQRQLQLTGATTKLGAAKDQLTALQGLNKPVGVSAGTSLVNPQTGATVASGTSLADQNAISTFFNLQQSYPDAQIAWDPSKSAQANLQAAQSASSNSPTYQAKATTIRSVQLPGGGLGFYNSKDGNIYDSNGSVIGNIGSGANPTVAITSDQGATTKADAASLTQQTEYRDTVQRSFNTANDNLNSIISYMSQAGINTGSSVPLINELQNKVKAGATDPGAIAGFQAALTGLRQEYSQVLARGGARSASTDSEAAALIPDNLSPAQLQQVAARLNTEGSNAIKSANQQITDIQARMKTQSPGGSNTNFGTGSSNNATPGSVPSGWNW